MRDLPYNHKRDFEAVPSVPPPKRLVKNAARCTTCNTVLESKHRHDFVVCPCGNAVDGGLDYERRVGNLDALEDLSEYA